MFTSADQRWPQRPTLRYARRRRLNLSILLAVVVAAGIACRQPQKPEFLDLTDVELTGANADGVLQIEAVARFHNPNGVALNVTGIDLQIFAEDRHVADVRQREITPVPARADFDIPVEIQIPVTELYEDVGDLLGGLLSNKRLELRVDGRVLVKLLGVELVTPFQHRHEVEI